MRGNLWNEIEWFLEKAKSLEKLQQYDDARRREDWESAHDLMADMLIELNQWQRKEIDSFAELRDHFINVRNSYIQDIKIIRGAISSMGGKRAERDAFIKDLLAKLCNLEYADTRSGETWTVKRRKK